MATAILRRCFLLGSLEFVALAGMQQAHLECGGQAVLGTGACSGPVAGRGVDSCHAAHPVASASGPLLDPLPPANAAYGRARLSDAVLNSLDLIQQTSGFQLWPRKRP
ncbi:hypothetical protein ILFOPFJJ_05723 [Ensifer psoraleae]|nr:hypothetical protein [Sinorhizobium psoraleae]